jgi:hypothetical protein
MMTNTTPWGWKYMVNWLARRDHVVPVIQTTGSKVYQKLKR